MVLGCGGSGTLAGVISDVDWVGLIGYFRDCWSGTSGPLYRCVVRVNGDHFDSVDPYCQGQGLDALLGYTLR